MIFDDGQKAAFLARAYEKAQNSPDRSNQNAALLVNDVHDHDAEVSACNTFPPGVEFTEVRASERPGKYRYFEHAERGAIYEAAHIGLTTFGATMFCPWAACCDCARAIICASVGRLVLHGDRMDLTPERWRGDVDAALGMLGEAGVEIDYVKGPIDSPPIRVNGVLWSPKDLQFVQSGPGNGHLDMNGTGRPGVPDVRELMESEE